MRLLHVIRTLDPAWGGPVEGLASLTRMARAYGVEVEICTVDEPDSPWTANWDFPVHGVGGVPQWLGKGVATYGRTGKLDLWLRDNLSRFDAVVVHSIWMYFSYAVWKATRKVQVPYFLFIHGALDPWFKEYYPKKNPKKTAYWKLFEHKVLRDAARVIFTTEEEKLRADKVFLPYECNPFVGGYGVPQPPVEPLRRSELRRQFEARYPALNGRPFVAFLGRIHEKKGLDLLLRAYSMVKSKLGSTALVVTGPGDPSRVTRFQDLTQELGLSNDVVWTGPLFGNDKWGALQTAEAFILPSHQENYGISVVEALGCGVPVLISDKVNIWREVTSSNAGFVEPDTLAGTAKLLERWAQVPEVRRRAMSGNASQCFSSFFDINVNAPLFFDLIAQHVSQAPRVLSVAV